MRIDESIRIVVVLLGVGICPVKAWGVSVAVNPVADAFLSSASPSGNFGGAGALATSAAGLSQGEFQSLLRFDLSTVKSGFDVALGAGQWVVQSVSLQLTTANPANPVFNPNAAGQFNLSWMQNDTWVEGTGTPGAATSDGVVYNTLGSFLSGSDQVLGTFAFAGGTSGNNTFSLALVGGLLADISGGSPASVRLFAADSTLSYLVNSRSFGTAVNRPLLTVSAVAVPEPALAFALALAPILGARRR
ncbi:MAG: hypothetical protein ACREJC_01885 [Tepidisphaeraceae bacterium]